MKKFIALVVIIVALAGTLFYRTTLREREVVILSTNDMHANIENFPSLVTAVNLCRDTVSTLLVDAGDRWTGNVFIDLAEDRLPIIGLMNHVGYDVATLGNHEFDKGPKLLQSAISHAKFPILCANLQSNKEELATPQAAVSIKSSNGVRFRVAGVVTFFDGGHPEGSNEVYEGLTFCHPFDAATKALAEAKRGEVRLLLSHMGDDKDFEYASVSKCCDVIIGGHTHAVVDSVVNNIVIGQTGRKLKNIGATTVRLKGNRISSIDYRNIPLADYEKDSATLALIEQIEDNPALKVTVGTFANSVSHVGFADLLTRSLAEAMGTQLAFYHYGGIRLAEHPAGDIKLSTIYNLEPFESKIHTIVMTPAQLRAMIIAKYNDTENPKESHRVDLFCNTPYDIVLDSRGEAVDVLFPKLKEGRKYSVAMADYIGKKYPSIEGENRTEHNILVTDVVLDYLRHHPNTKISNHQMQKRVKR